MKTPEHNPCLCNLGAYLQTLRVSEKVHYLQVPSTHKVLPLGAPGGMLGGSPGLGLAERRQIRERRKNWGKGAAGRGRKGRRQIDSMWAEGKGKGEARRPHRGGFRSPSGLLGFGNLISCFSAGDWRPHARRGERVGGPSTLV